MLSIIGLSIDYAWVYFMKPLSTGLSADLNLACFYRNNLKPKIYYRKIKKNETFKIEKYDHKTS